MDTGEALIFTKDYMPQFREADADGKIGLRGYMNYFQDMATHYMHNLHKGNDTLPEEYGIVWLYTKYRLHIEEKADFSDEGLHFETWVEKTEKPSLILRQDMTISRQERLFACGKLELCLFNMQTAKLCRTGEIEYPLQTTCDKRVELPPFERFRADDNDGDKNPSDFCYTHRVRYTDLDKSMHMNNIMYIHMFLNAFDSAFYRQHWISDFEIHYLRQCYEGEEIRIYKRRCNGGFYLTGQKENGEKAVEGMLYCR